MYAYSNYTPQEQYPPKLPLPTDFTLQQSGSGYGYDASSYGSGYTANPTPGYNAYGASSYAIPTYSYNIYINGVRLNDNDVTILKRASPMGGPIADGAYWYDRMTGCWGYWGGPTQGWIMPGMTVGGDLNRSASGGDTGVFINGREVHQQELAALSNRGIQLFPGSTYNMDAFGRIMNSIGTQITQLFPNPFAVQLQQMVLNCVSPTVAQGMPAALSTPTSSATPFNPDYYSSALSMSQPQLPQQYQMPMQQQPQQTTQVPGKAALLETLSNLGNGKITPDSINTLLNNYSSHWSSDLLKTFLKGYISNLKKSKKHKKTVKLLEAGMKMLEQKYGLGGGSSSATDKGISEDMLGNMFDFEGTGLDRISDAITKYSA